MEFTLAILKPDCIQKKLTGKAIEFIEERGFEIVKLRKQQLTVAQAKAFYSDHIGKEFYEGLVDFMTSGPCIAMVVKKDNCVEDFRETIGKTDPKKAEPGTLRKLYAETIRRNVVHGSDCPENAKKEIAFFFPIMDITI